MSKSSNSSLKDSAKALLLDNVSYLASPYDDNSDSHPPITPLNQPIYEDHFNPDRFPNKMKLYEFIGRYFMATLSEPCAYEETTLQFDIDSEKYNYRYSLLTSAGFTKFYDEPLKKLDNLKASALKSSEDTQFKALAVKVEEVSEMPPQYLSEAELIEQMAEHGIGTDGTIPKIINNTLFRRYIDVCKLTATDTFERLKPTPLGLALAIGYQQIDSFLLLPDVRYFIEKLSQKVARCEIEYEAAMDIAINVFYYKLEEFKVNSKTYLTPMIKKMMSNEHKFYLEDFSLSDKKMVSENYYVSRIVDI